MRPGRTVASVLALLALAMVLNSVLRNRAFGWDVVAQYFTTTAIVQGLLLTLWLTAAVMVLGFALGTVFAVFRLSDNPVLRSISWGFVWIFRSTPLLVQLLFWFNIGALYPTLGLGLPFGPEFLTVKTVDLFGPTLTAVIGLTLHEAAYAAEVVRGGILSVDQGQLEAAQLIYNQTYQVIPLLLVATVWYVAVTSVLSVGQYYLERYYARGAIRGDLPPTPLQRARALFARTGVAR